MKNRNITEKESVKNREMEEEKSQKGEGKGKKILKLL